MIHLDSFKSDVSETNSVKFTESVVISAAEIRRKLRMLLKVGLFVRHHKFYSSSSCMKVSKKIPLVFENQIVFQFENVQDLITTDENLTWNNITDNSSDVA